jgi:Sec-independent protein translocase protein TatA
VLTAPGVRYNGGYATHLVRQYRTICGGGVTCWQGVRAEERGTTMFGLQAPELLIILVIVIVLFGATACAASVARWAAASASSRRPSATMRRPRQRPRRPIDRHKPKNVKRNVRSTTYGLPFTFLAHGFWFVGWRTAAPRPCVRDTHEMPADTRAPFRWRFFVSGGTIIALQRMVVSRDR